MNSTLFKYNRRALAILFLCVYPCWFLVQYIVVCMVALSTLEERQEKAGMKIHARSYTDFSETYNCPEKDIKQLLEDDSRSYDRRSWVLEGCGKMRQYQVEKRKLSKFRPETTGGFTTDFPTDGDALMTSQPYERPYF